jgi:hypothetical protein
MLYLLGMDERCEIGSYCNEDMERTRHVKWLMLYRGGRQSHLNNFLPKVISKLSEVYTIAKYRRCYPRDILRWEGKVEMVKCVENEESKWSNTRVR